MRRFGHMWWIGLCVSPGFPIPPICPNPPQLTESKTPKFLQFSPEAHWGSTLFVISLQKSFCLDRFCLLSFGFCGFSSFRHRRRGMIYSDYLLFPGFCYADACADVAAAVVAPAFVVLTFFFFISFFLFPCQIFLQEWSRIRKWKQNRLVITQM